MALTKKDRRTRIKKRIRKSLYGTPERPRMSVYRSNKNIFVQMVDDLGKQTLTSASSLNKEVLEQSKDISKSEQAKLVGNLIAKKSKEKGIETVVFDRSGYRYHGRIKELANAAREGGLKF